MGEPLCEQLGANFFAIHVHEKGPDGKQDSFSAEFIAAVKASNTGIFEIDSISMNFMGGMMAARTENHDGTGVTAWDALVVRRK